MWASKRYVDVERIRGRAAEGFDRSFYPQGGPRQLAAMYASGDRTTALHGLDIPCLVIHGRDDTLITPDAAAATAAAIPGAHLLLVGDMGHDVPPPLWNFIVSAILRRHCCVMTGNRGPLAGYRIIEIAGIGPGPMAAMLLADLGAEVIRVERAAAAQGPAPDDPHVDITLRGRRNLALDLKQPQGVSAARSRRPGGRVDRGVRPGVMERLGGGAAGSLERNPRPVYGRMTGWGQDGPWATAAGHDINYISLAGVLAHCRRNGQPPTPPLNLVGDYGGERCSSPSVWCAPCWRRSAAERDRSSTRRWSMAPRC